MSAGPPAFPPEAPTWLVVNPQARRGREGFERARQWLNRAVNLTGAFLPASPQEMQQLLRQAVEQGVRRVVVGGGDGTLSRAADVLQGTDVALAVLPLGTGNTFAWGIGLPPIFHEWLAVVSEGQVARFDLGEAQSAGRRKVFLNTATIGVSERLVELLTPEAKRRLGWLAWPLAFRRALASTPAIWVELDYGTERDHFWTRQLVVANGRTVAGPIVAARDASAQDGWLEVFSLGGPSPWGMARSTLHVLCGRQLGVLDSHYHKATAFALHSAPPVPLDIDGDVWETTPVAFRILPQALKVLVPGVQEGGSRPHFRLFIPAHPVEGRSPASLTAAPSGGLDRGHRPRPALHPPLHVVDVAEAGRH